MKRIIVSVFCMAILAGCQSNKSNAPVAGTTYQGMDPSSRTRDKSEVARARTALAGQYIAQRQLDAAKRQLDEAFEADSRYAPAYDMMGNLLRTEGSPANVAKADEFFRKAISLDPSFTQARNNYGVYLSERGKYKEAIEQFSIAGGTLGYRGRVGALENLGLTYLKVGNVPAAEATFNKAMQTDAGAVIAKLEMIDILIDKKQSMQAKQYFEDLKAMSQAYGEPMPPRLVFQGIRLSILQNNRAETQKLSSQLLAQYPLSDEAKRLKTWLSNPNGVLK